MIRLRPSILFLCLAAAVLFFSRSLLHPGFFFAHDFTHASRIVEMRRALEAGAFPVAWTQNFGFGYGMPLFLFYGPLPFYVGVILTWLGWSTIGAIKMLILLSGALAAAGMATLFRHRGRSVALTAGLVLLAFPYRAVDIFVRGALSEALAIGLLPWILVGAQQLPWHPRRGMLMTSAAVAALLLTHNLTAFIGLPILAGLGVIWLLLFADFPWRRVGQYFLAGLLGVALSFFFTLPVIFENQATSVASITTGGYFDFHLHFLYIRQFFLEQWGYGGSEFGPNDGISFHLGTPVLLSLVGMTFFLSWYLWKNRQKALHSPPFWWKVILMAALGGSLVMTLFHAQRIWEAIPALTFIQFPWRFLAVVGVLAATISGEVLSALHIRWQRWGLALILCTLALAQVRFHQPQSFLDRPYDLYVVEPGRIQTKMSGILPDFIPAGFDRSLPPIDSSQRIVLNNHTLKEDFSTPHRLRFFGEGQAEGTILWNIADFPGWQYYVNDQPVEPELREDGRREYTIQEPVESVGAIFTATPVRIWGQWISVGALFIWLLLALPFRVPGLKIKSSKHVKT